MKETMEEKHTVLAFDVGAESGRAVLGTIGDGRVALREVHRFPNPMIPLFGCLHWDPYALYAEMLAGLKLAAAACPEGLASVAVDTWGVDFGLLARDGSLLGLPFAYRDLRNVRAMEDFLARKVSRERVYEITGIQFLPFNSLFQLHALALDNPALLGQADRLLFMPDLLTYFLCGRTITEATIASTSQLVDPRRGEWSGELLSALGVRPEIFQPRVAPGTVVGRLRPEIAREAGLPEIPVVAAASHDTASAVAAVPARGRDWAYISSGTWSLMGVETDAPLITPETRRLNFTNEGGMDGRIRFLKNVTGLWLIQQCRKAWTTADRAPTYDELRELAAGAPPFRAFIDPDAPDFLNPPDMPTAIREFCRRTGQRVPETPAEIVRCALESLALAYRTVLDDLGRVAPGPIRRIHVIGGGSRHPTLCRFTACATGLPVAAGPVEATALGNVLGQALALGRLGSTAEMRALVAAGEAPTAYEPADGPAWEAAYARFRDVLPARPGSL
jgi:rhamnulokinase